MLSELNKCYLVQIGNLLMYVKKLSPIILFLVQKKNLFIKELNKFNFIKRKFSHVKFIIAKKMIMNRINST